MPLIQLTPAAIQQIRTFLAEHGGDAPLRIDLQSTGCCDPSLGICVDRMRENDLMHETDGLRLLISPEAHRTVGDVCIDFKDDGGESGYVLTSSRPLSEWEGFGLCQIRVASGE